MKKTGNKSIIVKILLAAIVALYFLFLYIDLFRIDLLSYSNMAKFLSISLVFLMSLAIGRNSISARDIMLLRMGLFITIGADFFSDLF